ncbi:Reverse transcriptase zinc-binding domain [Arabidopsis suecica]|uniref:Reverse transcriptase zinc-binding domain n=1 Tax=Arabidopsis suecica TaxID=45249 RepID=A0A8T2CX12_ARASU|nr:Reverse transcriptase zinc-binding domain [Arabidopsis suecica]
MTSFFAWNTRGFNMPRKHNVVRSWIQAVKPSFGSFLETRVQEMFSESIISSILPGWSKITNYDHHRLGRIWVCWNTNDVSIVPIFQSAQHITSCVTVVSSGVSFLCTFVYASNFVVDRRALWSDLCHVKSAMQQPTSPWIVLGDFNEILSMTDHSRALDYAFNVTGMHDFQNTVSFCDLGDLSSAGPNFTWINNQDSNPIGKKPDRTFTNPEWHSTFPHSYATFEAGGISDHSRCMIHLSTTSSQHRKPFKFFNFLISHSLFLPTVAQVWSESPPLYHSRVALSLFHRKLKRLKPHLRGLNKSQFGDLPKKTKEAYDLFCVLQAAALSDPSQSNVGALADASENWQRLASIEEKNFHQKSRIKWMKCGDQNTSYFHRVAQANASRNAICNLTLASGEVITQPDQIKSEAARHFREFLQAEVDDFEEISQHSLSELLGYHCSPVRCAELMAPVSSDEIKKALFSLPSGKACGPDGYTKEFYVAAWNVIGADFVVAVQSFFLFGQMPRSVNATLLALIPKNPDATSATMKDYRPIACCNMLYKVVSKILANRLKLILPDFIEPNQSAFIKGRLLLENVLLSTELVKDYHKDSIAPRSAIKFDISKAFDTVQWPFVMSIFRALGFPEGCSLSPYLFVMVQNVLSKLLNRAADLGRIGRHPHCNHISVTHLSFADDIIVFSDGSPSSLRETVRDIEDFTRISGLHINPHKSALYVGGRNRLALMEAATAHGIPIETLPIRYLGLPLTTRSMTTHDYTPLIDKIRSRLLSWTNKHLSYAGRLQLIKSVISSISNFWCSVFRLPARCFDEIESLCGAFLLSGNPNTSSGAKICWNEVCSLWVAWTKQNLMKRGSFWTAPNTTLGSWIWRKLLKLREEIRPFLRVEIGNGENASFWYDCWLPMGRILDVTGQAGPRILGIPLHVTVKEATGANGWLILLNRLSTGARMRFWGCHQVCVFCGEGDETRDHLFFACPYSYTIWSSIGGKLLRSRLSPDWDDRVASIQSLTGDKLRDILVRLSFQATLYSIWRERNARIHTNGGLSGLQLTKMIEKLIRNRITSLDYSAKPHLRLLMQRWIMVRP